MASSKAAEQFIDDVTLLLFACRKRLRRSRDEKAQMLVKEIEAMTRRMVSESWEKRAGGPAAGSGGHGRMSMQAVRHERGIGGPVMAKNQAAVSLGRAGGQARASNLTDAQRSASAKKAAQARWKGHMPKHRKRKGGSK